jgi:hypothetical protein
MQRMLTNKQTATIATVAGGAVYYCEWLELVTPGFCNQSLRFTLTRMYVVPLLLAGVIGYFGYKKPMMCWLLFMLPSWIVRLILLLEVGGNLWPLLFMVDLLHLILIGLVIGGAAIFRKGARRSVGPQQ